jgi:carboxypeptidase C (cathepsin A)
MGGAGSENGPFYVDPNTNTAKVRDIAWNQKADVLFVDNPLGTGFSFGEDSKLAKDGEDVKAYFY